MILPQRQTRIVLSDGGRLWNVWKQLSRFLAEAYNDLGQQSRSERVGKCATYLAFLQCQNSSEHPKKLTASNFCRDRLCPQCQQRRSARQFAVSVQLGHELLRRHPSFKFIFLTLTVPNVSLDKLEHTITHILQSWHRLMMRSEIKRAVKGYMRTLEITYNRQRNDWHPHIHAALVVQQSYFTSRDYIKRDRWLQMWQEATRQPEITQVDIRVLKPNKKAHNGIDPVLLAFAELSKYAVKDWSVPRKELEKLSKQSKAMTRDVEGHAWLRKSRQETAVIVEKLQAALYRRRLVHYGGLLKEIKREMKLKDGEDEGSDLINTSGEKTGCQCAICGGDMREIWYRWQQALANYYAS